jgi:quercetin dioxygenase-like cupin family protein
MPNKNARRRFLATAAASVVAAEISFIESAYPNTNELKRQPPLEPTLGAPGVEETLTRSPRLIASDQQIQTQEPAMARTHQPGQAIFRAVLPEDIDWKPFPAFPPSVRLAVIVGQPSEPAPYVIRVKTSRDGKLMPHRHPEDRIYTVISGVFYIGLGDRFDGNKVVAYPPGSVIVLPGNTSHFHWAKSGEYVTQITAIGPLGLEYLDLADDPREAGR